MAQSRVPRAGVAQFAQLWWVPLFAIAVVILIIKEFFWASGERDHRGTTERPGSARGSAVPAGNRTVAAATSGQR
jgi:hypothetical protein